MSLSSISFAGNRVEANASGKGPLITTALASISASYHFILYRGTLTFILSFID
ncbi:MAG: hypothetical protein U5J63_14720 [Fodinibius sp.]|nr:hypothetical protein [Fodinibius sp.]